ncbi:FAD-dependent monooxygenase [Saccharopolyspora phatthalungensis]|uniref:2-polyprenyl-6-methoxyphenol hydroxylase-like FAD-dependent oxidoreductase n=1 Tax=Saccharopolyspora phatthalungensis TaxID=664693 RepID=A0A840QDR6_9PSEU|nr:FAD-dependent monooxygenase [Saccharopolyspora phatthalungensis]MBB5158081.1 2-polyprenyl-6-methoxyphenol hydroxylase-like FAD-dependent oxidoreductase [Saccharopolyspora phatthalungensis]
MKIVCIGAGPAGLYLAISAKLRDAGHDVTVIERDPPGATYGWGVGYGENLLDTLYRNDKESAERIRAESTLWQEQVIAMRGDEKAYLGGYGFSINRAPMLEILAERATGMGVKLDYERAVEDLSELSDADLVVVADGANSRIRQRYSDEFGTSVDHGRNPYIWLGTDKVFDMFTYDFEETPEGWIWFHAYPSSTEVSTFVVECQEPTWRGLGLDRLDAGQSMRLLERIFARPLEGGSLISQSRGKPASWQRFTQVFNQTWRHGNAILIGDAAHTTHFTIGSGTRLAMLDAIVLADKLFDHDNLATALKEFDEEGHTNLRRLQATARSSMAWYEHIDRYIDRNVVDFCYAMACRHGGQPPWRYLRHVANQNFLVRKGRRLAAAGGRRFQAHRRGEAWR